MPSSSSNTNSFIPKRGTSRQRRSQPARKIFVLTIIAYSFVFASLLAAGASVLYQNYIESELEKEVILLNKEVNTFSVKDLQRVAEFNKKLVKTTDRVLNTASIVAVLDELEQSTVEPVQIYRLTVDREKDSSFIFDLELKTDSLDAALFQRKTLLANSQIFSDVLFSDINLLGVAAEGDRPEDTQITLNLAFQIPLEAMLYSPTQALNTEQGTAVVQTESPVIDGLDEGDTFTVSSSSNDTSI